MAPVQTGARKGHAFFVYATNYLIDLEHAVIVDVGASRAIRQAEVGAARIMIERAQHRFDRDGRRERPPPPGSRRPRDVLILCPATMVGATMKLSTAGLNVSVTIGRIWSASPRSPIDPTHRKDADPALQDRRAG
jgi:hypothetical protein